MFSDVPHCPYCGEPMKGRDSLGQCKAGQSVGKSPHVISRCYPEMLLLEEPLLDLDINLRHTVAPPAPTSTPALTPGPPDETQLLLNKTD